MPSMEQEERNKTIIRSFIEEIFSEHNLSSIEKYFGNKNVEGSPQAGKSGERFKLMLTEFFKAFPDGFILNNTAGTIQLASTLIDPNTEYIDYCNTN